MKKVNVLRSLKSILKRDSLLKNFRSFILQILECASELGDGCTAFECNLLEKAELEATRIITGFTSFFSVNSLYLDMGLEPLSAGRKGKKLHLLYKMHNNQTPSCLNSLLPNTVGQATPYPLRHINDYNIPRYRLTSTNISFLPASLRSWNNLPATSRPSPTLNSFKREIYPKDLLKPPSYYNYGNRKTNILHCKLRNNCSSLHNDLFRVNFAASPQCRCGSPCENAYHYFLECCLCNEERRELFASLSNINSTKTETSLEFLQDITI